VKRWILRVLIGLGVLLLLAVCLGGVATWRAKRSMDKRKPEVIALTERFTKCFYNRDQPCLDALTTWDEKRLSGAGLVGFTSQITERLGQRRGAIPVDKSWSWKSFANVNGKTTTFIAVVMVATYDADPKTEEHFELVDDSRGLRVRNYHVNSPLIFQAPVPKQPPN
jgi:hypothetical protein